MCFLVKKKKGKIQNNPVIVSYFALCFTARSRHFSEILNACVSALLFYLPLITFGSIRFGHYSVIYLMERRSTLRPEHFFHSIRYISSVALHYNSFRSFANSKTLAIIVSKKTRLSSSDNAVMSGVPTVTISSSVFSTFITSLRLFFERQKNTPHYLGSKTAKSKGLSGKFYNFFCALAFSPFRHLKLYTVFRFERE